jgi:hypothetical protein
MIKGLYGMATKRFLVLSGSDELYVPLCSHCCLARQVLLLFQVLRSAGIRLYWCEEVYSRLLACVSVP